VFVNNGGFGAPSGETGHTIDDTDDGEISIQGIAKFTGFIDLEGRADDSGATITVYDNDEISSADDWAQGVSLSSGKYTTDFIGSNRLLIGDIYYFLVDAPLYLPTTVDAADFFANGAELTTRNLTSLDTLLLLGGDATNDNDIQIVDLSCIGADYNVGPDLCGIDGSSDVNADGVIDIYDLVLAGGNYNKQASPWTVTVP
jgi:hypothetical protein